jgi:hypothetical protein
VPPPTYREVRDRRQRRAMPPSSRRTDATVRGTAARSVVLTNVQYEHRVAQKGTCT